MSLIPFNGAAVYDGSPAMCDNCKFKGRIGDLIFDGLTESCPDCGSRGIKTEKWYYVNGGDY